VEKKEMDTQIIAFGIIVAGALSTDFAFQSQ
jgi:hypothetical protein